ncbi:NUDIX hydrolase [Secundilactobacillus kimchicus]|uniref:NUDIX hydrolase n=1 Tax=Secundilactobacillus kimchicus TaxID=528209 RepID=UPI0024A9CB24|nr:NUDIX hydrolase [Secundilactobacillus kimchicus]
MNLKEEVVEKKQLYHGAIIDLERQTVRLPNGETAHREIVRHSGAVGVIAITDDERLILVKQWRAPIGQPTLEIPAGKLDDRDSTNTEHAANRELNEEIRLHAGHLEKITGFYSSVGFSDEYMTLYLATDLQPVADELPRDAGENLEIVKYRLLELKKLMATGQIQDAKTVMAVWYFELMQHQGR